MNNDLSIWMNAAGKRRLEPEQTDALLSRLATLKKGTPKYRRTFDRIVEGNLLLVAKTVQALIRPRASLRWGDNLTVDLLQVGYFGLAVAVERFDVTRGTKLSTCAVPWIRQRVARWLNNHQSSIYVPENTLRAAYAIRRGEDLNKAAPKDFGLIEQAMRVLSMSSLDIRINDDEGNSPTIGEMLTNPSDEEKPRGRDEQILMLREVMAKAGIEPRIQDLMVAYAQRGSITSTAIQLGMNPGTAGKAIKAAVAKCRAVA